MPERGPLVVIGGHEDREGERVILREVATQLAGRTLLVCAAGSKRPEKYIALYREAFAGIGVQTIEFDPATATGTGDAGGVFFTGGSQGRLVESLLASGLDSAVRSLWEQGGVIAGTSAGASALAETMITGASGDETPEEKDIDFTSGLGLIPDVIVDQHFAERGRIGRLAIAVGVRPELLGIGIDEDTAVVITGDRMRVIGSGDVYVLDGSVSSQSEEIALTLLASGSEFDIPGRRLAVG
jgi:cyanophycinase